MNSYESGVYSCSYDQTWKFSGWKYFKSKFLPINLAEETNQISMKFGSTIFGLILPYPHGSDDDHYMGTNQLSPEAIRMLKMAAEKDPRYRDVLEKTLWQPEPRYLHLFNTGKVKQVVSGMVDGASFENVEVNPKQRVILMIE